MNVYHESMPSHQNLSIDAGLDRCIARSKHGEEWELKAIAEECGCTFQYIQQVEASAIKHLRNRLAAEVKEISPLTLQSSNF
ncbi:MAG: hypothetical protein AAGJ81_15950 [Verrucomicrobiota bacterium]